MARATDHPPGISPVPAVKSRALVRRKPAAAPEPDWDVVPSPSQAQEIAKRCRKLVNQRALMAAGVALVPIPGLDWVTDVGVLIKLLPEINRAFGLSPQQVDRLAPDRRVVVYKAISAGGSMLVGRIITKSAVMTALKLVGIRLTTQQAAKFVPIAGQAVSAVLTFSALKYVCELHIKQCIAICDELDIPSSGPVDLID